MRNQKKARCSLSKTAGRIIALTLIMAVWTGGTELTARSGRAVQGVAAVTAVSAEAAVRQAGKTAFTDAADSSVRQAGKTSFADAADSSVRQAGKTAFADAADLAGQNAEKKEAAKSIPDKIKEKLPDIDLPGIDLPDFDLPDLHFSKLNPETEKEKLRKAVRKMDEIGISPERLVQKAWDFLNRKDNREKIDKAVEDIREQVQDKTEKASGQEK